jgi:hypothetical protein
MVVRDCHTVGAIVVVGSPTTHSKILTLSTILKASNPCWLVLIQQSTHVALAGLDEVRFGSISLHLVPQEPLWAFWYVLLKMESRLGRLMLRPRANLPLKPLQPCF